MMAFLAGSEVEHLVGLRGYATVQKCTLSPDIVCVSASWTEQLCCHASPSMIYCWLLAKAMDLPDFRLKCLKQ